MKKGVFPHLWGSYVDKLLCTTMSPLKRAHQCVWWKRVFFLVSNDRMWINFCARQCHLSSECTSAFGECVCRWRLRSSGEKKSVFSLSWIIYCERNISSSRIAIYLGLNIILSKSLSLVAHRGHWIWLMVYPIVYHGTFNLGNCITRYLLLKLVTRALNNIISLPSTFHDSEIVSNSRHVIEIAS